VGAAASETNIGVFDEVLRAALDRAESRLGQVKRADAKTKLGQFALLDEALREVATVRRSFNGELQLLRSQDKGPYGQALEGFDQRITALDQQAKVERATFDKAALFAEKRVRAADPAHPPSDNDRMLKETADVQAKTTASLQRIAQRATEARDMGKETAESLKDQQEQMLRIGVGVARVDDEILRANRIM